jgi:hypothetical protein
MQEQHSTLLALRQEARNLEFNVDLSSGHIELIKKSDPDMIYISPGKAYQQVAIQDAWNWLQLQRERIDQADIERTDQPVQSEQDCSIRLHILIMLYLTATLFAPAFGVGVLLLFLTNNVWVGYSGFFLLMAIQSLRMFKRYWRNG